MMEHVEQQLGNYRLIQLLGKGAFADVYLGEHLYVNVPPVRDRRLLRSCPRGALPAHLLFAACQNVDGRVDIPV